MARCTLNDSQSLNTWQEVLKEEEFIIGVETAQNSQSLTVIAHTQTLECYLTTTEKYPKKKQELLRIH